MPDLTVSADIDAFLASANDAAARTELGLTALATTTPGTGVATALAANIGSAGAPVLFNGAGGTPTSIVLTNASGTAASLTAGTASAVAVGGITGLGANVATFLATPSSANFASAVTGETGSGALVFGTSPAFTTNFTLANGAAPTTSAVAQMAFDTDAWAASRGAVAVHDGTAVTWLVGVLASDTPSNGQVPTWNTGGTITWETPGGAANAVTAASAAAGAGLLWTSGGADRSAVATDTVTTLNATNSNVDVLKIMDAVDQSHGLSFVVSSNLAADKTFTYTGAFNFTMTLSADTSVTYPVSGTLYSSGTTDVAVADGGTGLSSGTSGGVLGFTAAGTIASSAALAANAIVIGGGAGATPTTTTTGNGVLTQLGLAADGSDVDAIGFRGVPVNSQSAAYTTVMADNGKTILHPTADNNARTFTIAANASVAYELGTTITFINQINTVTIAINSDTLVLAGAGTTGSRTLAANGIATAVKIASTTWMINGTGLT